MWQVGGLGPMPGQVHAYLLVEDEAARAHPLARYQKETNRLYGVLDVRLAGREFVATAGEPSIADFAILGWVWRHERHRIDLATLPNVKAWYERMMARPAVQRGFAVPMRDPA
jgi:GST-like protein